MNTLCINNIRMKVAAIESSIFDSYYKMTSTSRGFEWQLPDHNYVFSDNDLVHSGVLQESRNNSSGIYPAKFFVVTTNALYRFANSSTNTPEAVLPLQMARLELFKDNSLWKYGFSLTAHENTCRFITQSKEEASKWYAKLKKQCTVTLLHITKSYVIGNTIRRGGYYKLQMAANSESKGQFMVKSILKSHLVENPTRLVLLLTP